MQKDPYLVLGVDNTATQEQIEKSYQTLKAKFSELRFEEGEVGNDATRRLEELEIARQECLEHMRQSISYSNYGSSYSDIEQIIKDGKLEDAQIMLDKIDNRDGNWHYLQAILYHKRNWNVESKKQLEIALALEPDNDKYTRALNNLKAVISKDSAPNGGANNDQQQQNDNGGARAGYSRPTNQGGGMDSTNACCSTCQTLICLDCCCNCISGGSGGCC